MKAQPHAAPLAQVVPGLEQPVLDHAGGSAHQTQGVAVVAPMVARYVQCAQHVAARVANRGCSAGQKSVALQVMLVGMHHHSTPVGQRGADGIGAPILLVPGGAGAQRHALCPAGELRIAQSLQQQATGLGQDDHAVSSPCLLEYKLHHRHCVSHQLAPQLQRPRQLGARGVRRARHAATGLQAGVPAAQP